MKKPKTIKIFLPEGSATGTKVVEISNWTGISYLIPRIRLKDTLSDINNKNDLDSQCVYILIGENEGGTSVYVGEAEEFSKRILQHEKSKDFWNLVIVFTSKDENLTKAHVKYLESKITKEIKANNIVNLENGNIPPMPKLPRSTIAEVEEYFEMLKLIASSLGYTFLETVNKKEENLFYCKGKETLAKGIMTDEGFLVLEGSLWDKTIAKSFTTANTKTREKFINSEKISKNSDGDYVLNKNILFSSPSYASSMSLGRSSNGWTDWKNNENKTLDEVYRSNS